ncbi:YwdI family protein [Oceanobacillus sp. FSL K6-2867]|uniref:YwdI family protein n=1 Tax=Oceanobacillus sp. FSL K6-2867 TaxID=2954748 RepID=UPI0030D8A5FB
MAVANETIIKKMQNELYLAKDNEHAQDQMMRHIANVRLLCDLFLEGNQPVVEQEKIDFSEAEMKVMFGEQKIANDSLKVKKPLGTKLNDDDANGDSIFDF